MRMEVEELHEREVTSEDERMGDRVMAFGRCALPGYSK
jgi:hypothetical protein